MSFVYYTLVRLMKIGQFIHIMQQYSQWVAAALISWPYDHVSAATHSLPGRQQTGCSCVCFRAVTPPQAPSFLQSVLCSVPAAPGAVRRREPTPTYHSFSFKGTDLIGLFCCAYRGWEHELSDPNRISRGF